MDLIRYECSREDREDLVFDGSLLAHVSSERKGALRWSELWLFRTVDKRPYVLAGRGATLLPGEDDIFWADTLVSADDVLRRLSRHSDTDEEYLTVLARTLLGQAAVLDDAVAQMLVAHSVSV